MQKMSQPRNTNAHKRTPRIYLSIDTGEHVGTRKDERGIPRRQECMKDSAGTGTGEIKGVLLNDTRSAISIFCPFNGFRHGAVLRAVHASV